MWTDERVTRLKHLWETGLSASQVAVDLGGITRNAVIGKVHRLGLSGHGHNHLVKREDVRWTPELVETLKALRAGQASAPAIAKALGLPRSAIVIKCRLLDLAPFKRQERKPRIRARRSRPSSLSLALARCGHAEPVVSDNVIPLEQRRALAQLTNGTCKWPVGDPRQPGFFFCGAAPAHGLPYCLGHALLAYRRAA